MTLGGNSNNAVPTENAVLGYMTRDQAGVGAWVPPTGTTAQRPTGGALYTGAIRYNTSLVAWEGYNGSSWTGLGGGTPYVTVVGDGSTITVAESNQRFLVNTSAHPHTIPPQLVLQSDDRLLRSKVHPLGSRPDLVAINYDIENSSDFISDAGMYIENGKTIRPNNGYNPYMGGIIGKHIPAQVVQRVLPVSYTHLTLPTKRIV